MKKPTDQQIGIAKEGWFEDVAEPSEAQQDQHAQARLANKRSEGAARLLQPNRLQVELRAADLESLLPEDHRARLVWGSTKRVLAPITRNFGIAQPHVDGIVSALGLLGASVGYRITLAL